MIGAIQKFNYHHKIGFKILVYFSSLAPIFLRYLLFFLSWKITVVWIILRFSYSKIPFICAVKALKGLSLDFSRGLSFYFYFSFYFSFGFSFSLIYFIVLVLIFLSVSLLYLFIFSVLLVNIFLFFKFFLLTRS